MVKINNREENTYKRLRPYDERLRKYTIFYAFFKNTAVTLTHISNIGYQLSGYTSNILSYVIQQAWNTYMIKAVTHPPQWEQRETVAQSDLCLQKNKLYTQFEL